MSTAPFKEDALNRYRITHSDRDLKPLIRRLNRLPLLSKSTDLSTDDVELERELIRMELLKWRIGIERILGSISNLDRQTECYKRQTRETVSKAEQLKLRLIQEKEELANKRKLREHQLKCDEIVKRIQGRGKTRKELDDQIESLTNSLKEHTESHSLYLSITQMRYEKFNEIIKLIDECRNLKLPVEPTSTLPTTSNPTEDIADETRMDIDPSSSSSNSASTSSKLNLSALEFQPSSSTNTSANRQSTVSAPNRSSAPPSGNGNLKPPSSGHMLPTRPSKPISGGVKLTRQNSNSISNGLPSRPSNLRSSTTPAALHTGLGSGSLEDGEVGPEEGEVASSASTNGGEESRKRARGSEAGQTRNTRSRAK